MSLHRAQECLSVPQEREGLPGTDPIVVSLLLVAMTLLLVAFLFLVFFRAIVVTAICIRVATERDILLGCLGCSGLLDLVKLRKLGLLVQQRAHYA